MLHFWGRRARKGTALPASALEEGAIGNITVVLTGGRLDDHLVSLGCQMARGAKRKVYLVHVIEVPRALPLKAVLTQEIARAKQVLHAAMDIAAQVRCEAVERLVQARATGSAIVDEAKEQHCTLILIGLVRKKNQELDQQILYVLRHAPCRVWMLQDSAQQI